LPARLGRRNPLHGPGEFETCVVDKDVDLAAIGDNRLDRGHHRSLFGDVQSHHPDPGLGQRGEGLWPARGAVHNQASAVKAQSGVPPNA
jgi:hypothetical protein